MIIDDILKLIENFAPKALALEWDNVGLIVGDSSAIVTNILTVVDCDNKAIDKAIDCGANLIISHHPVIFNPIKKITKDDYIGSIIIRAISHNISIIAAHTNMDKADKGINYHLAKMIGGVNISRCFDGECGVMMDIKPTSTEKIAKILNTELSLIAKLREPIVTLSTKDVISRVGIISGCGGRGKDIIPTMLSNKLDLMITAEYSNDIVSQMRDIGLGCIRYGHYDSEIIFTNIIQEMLIKATQNINKAKNLDIIKWF